MRNFTLEPIYQRFKKFVVVPIYMEEVVDINLTNKGLLYQRIKHPYVNVLSVVLKERGADFEKMFEEVMKKWPEGALIEWGVQMLEEVLRA